MKVDLRKILPHKKRGLKNPLKEVEVRQFCETEVFHAPLRRFEEINRGGSSLNYLAQTAENTYLVKLLNAEEDIRFSRLVRILRFFGNYPDFYTAHLTHIAEKPFQGYRVLATNFIYGKKITYKSLTPEVVRSIAESYRRFNNLTPQAIEEGRKDIHKQATVAAFIRPQRHAEDLYHLNREKILALQASSRRCFAPLLKIFFRYNELLYQNIPTLSAPLSVIHGDASLNNMLVTPDGRTALLDLECMRFGYPVEDAAEFLLSALLPHYPFFTPKRRLQKLMTQTAVFSAEEWRYGMTMYFLFLLYRRLNNGKLFHSLRKDLHFLLHMHKFHPLLSL